jgi:hypothetical protein
MSTYEMNRAKVPSEELSNYVGQWVAFSLDGSRVVAGAETLATLEERLAAAGVDPERVAFERIESEDSRPGAAELLRVV